MLIYLLKFSACLAIFLTFYKLFLERENMHQIKRYYLLAAILLSLSIPFITFTTYVEPSVLTFTDFQPLPEFSTQTEVFEEEPINYLPIILWSVYGLGVLLFLFKFILNLFRIAFKIKRNPKHKVQHFTHVLLHDLITPHTFFSYIFLNKHKFETQQIPKEVFIHEEAHAKQKHSIDVLIIELLQIVFWFNPLIYFFKHSIKMNHEFLADESVLRQGIEPSKYQQILLAFSSNVTEPQLANAINYSSIKKRFTVMKTHTSKQKIWLRSLLLLPLAGIALYGFSETKIVEKPIIQTHSLSLTNQQTLKTNPEKDAYYKNTIIEFVDKDKNLLESKKYSELTEQQKLQLPNPPKTPTIKNPSQKELDIWKDGKTYGVWIDNKRMQNDALKGFKPSDFSLYYVSKLEKNAINYGKHYFQVNLYSNENYKALYKNGVQPLGEGAVLRILSNTNESSSPVLEISHNPDVFKLNGKETSLSQLKEDFAKAINNGKSDLRIKTNGGIKMSLINQIMDELKGNLKQIRLDEAAYIIGDTLNNLQQKATPEEVAEYNKLAKHYNSQNPEKTIIKQKDVERLKFLYNKMDKEQKSKAEPFPNIVLPPPPPPAPEPLKTPPSPSINATNYKTGFIEVDGNTIYYTNVDGKTTYYNRRGYIVDKNGHTLNGSQQVSASDVILGQHISKIYKDDKVVAEFKSDKNRQDFPEAPAPPTPISPLDHVIDMSKKGATFFYEGKTITSDKAIQLLKKNEELNISTKEKDSKEPKVYISKEPIVMKN